MKMVNEASFLVFLSLQVQLINQKPFTLYDIVGYLLWIYDRPIMSFMADIDIDNILVMDKIDLNLKGCSKMPILFWKYHFVCHHIWMV